jgi:hypothetical protein
MKCECNSYCGHTGEVYQYEGREVIADPNAGVPEPLTTPRDDEWWYHGHPCEAYLTGRNHGGLRCDGVVEFGGPCAACAVALHTRLSCNEGYNWVIPDDQVVLNGHVTSEFYEPMRAWARKLVARLK